MGAAAQARTAMCILAVQPRSGEPPRFQGCSSPAATRNERPGEDEPGPRSESTPIEAREKGGADGRGRRTVPRGPVSFQRRRGAPSLLIPVEQEASSEPEAFAHRLAPARRAAEEQDPNPPNAELLRSFSSAEDRTSAGRLVGDDRRLRRNDPAPASPGARAVHGGRRRRSSRRRGFSCRRRRNGSAAAALGHAAEHDDADAYHDDGGAGLANSRAGHGSLASVACGRSETRASRPLTAAGSSASASSGRPAASNVFALITTSPAAAHCCRRLARLTVSPTTEYSVRCSDPAMRRRPRPSIDRSRRRTASGPGRAS